MLRIAFIIFVVSFTYNAQGKVPVSSIKSAHQAYLADGRVLLYIGEHHSTDKVVIWGQTQLTEDMVEVLLESPRNLAKMEALLRSQGKRWYGKYRAYSLHSFMLSEPNQTDSIFTKAVKQSPELHLLNGHVDRIEKVDGVTKFLDIKGNEVLLAEKRRGAITKCAMAEGGFACYRLYESFLEYSKNLAQDLSTSQYFSTKVITYFENNIQLLKGDGVSIAAMTEELGLKNSYALGRIISKLKKELSEDHFIHKLARKQRSVDATLVSYYHFPDVVDGANYKEEQVVAYFENNMQLMEEDGIIIAAMAEELGFTSGSSLGQTIKALKKKLPNEHFIHELVNKQRRVDDKIVTYYAFANMIRRKERQVVAYFENNMQLLEKDGIIIAEMAKELGFTSGSSLGRVVHALKEELPKEHFIHKLESSIQSVDGKQVIYYHFPDAISNQERQVIAYFEDNMQLLEENGISIAAMAEELGFTSGVLLGRKIIALKKKLPEEHFIHKHVAEARKGVTYYHFAETISHKKERIIAYFEDNMQLLEENGISTAAMAEELGLKNYSLGRIISVLKKELPEDHFIHKLVSKQRRVDDKRVSYYSINAVATP